MNSTMTFERVQRNAVVFILGLFVGGLAIALGLKMLSREIEFGIDDGLAQRFPSSWVDRTVETPEEAKKRHLFWATTFEGVGSKGVALRVLQNPELFHALFPGYPDAMAQDRSLWSDYFKRDFTPATWFALPSSRSQKGVMVYHSWTGCFDIFKRYGADVVLFGTSEAYRSLIPDLFAKQTIEQGPDELKRLKVLPCWTSGMPIEIVALSANEMLKQPQVSQPKLVVWGLSAWTFFVNSKDVARHIAEKTASFHAYERQSSHDAGLWQWLQLTRTSDFFPVFTWDSVMRTTFESLKRKTILPDPGTLKGDIYVKTNSDLRALRLKVAEVNPSFSGFAGISNNDCDFSLVQAKFDQAFSQLRRLARNVFLYRPPYMSLMTKAAPECFFPSLDRFVAARKSKGVIVLDEDWTKDGIDLTEFLYPTAWAQYQLINPNHVNERGGEVVTRRIVETLVEKANDLL